MDMLLMIHLITLNWFGSLSRGHVTVECTAYKGGVIVYAWQSDSFLFYLSKF